MTLKLPQHNRYDYSPITGRKDYSWPGGKRLAFCLTTNIAIHAFGNFCYAMTPGIIPGS